MRNILLILASVSLNASAQILMRKAMLRIGEFSFGVGAFFRTIPVLLSNGLLLLSFICYGFSIVLWIIVLSRVEVSFAYAFSSLGYVLVTIMGTVFLREHISMLKIIGISIICIGVILVSRS